jgi:hypothetical protein
MWGDKMRLCRAKTGLTMIEMSLVAALIAMVGLAVYGSFNSGLKIWQRVSRSLPEIEVGIFFDKISNDLRNWLVFSAAVPQGSKGELSFSLIQEKAAVKDAANPDFGIVRYYFNSESGCIYRDYRQLIEDKVARSLPIANGIVSLSFKYYYFDAALKGGAWEDELNKTVPLAVKVQVDFKSDKKVKRLTKVIEIYVRDAPI